MSVFTPVSHEELRQWLVGFPAGELVDMQGISAGIDNSNFFVTTTQATYVLTLFERLSEPEIDYYMKLMLHLSNHIPVAPPVLDNEGRLYRTLNGKKAALITKLPGKNILEPAVKECRMIGDALARLHKAGLEFTQHMPQPRGLGWCLKTADSVKPFLTPQELKELNIETDHHASKQYDALPQGVIHADLFRDNVLFDNGNISGIIDFYFSGEGSLLYDVAIVVNDWCLNPDYTIDMDRYRAFISAYQAVRPFTEAEIALWPDILRLGALRFWLSRLYDKYLPRPGSLVHVHNPDHFRNILQMHAAPSQVLTLAE